MSDQILSQSAYTAVINAPIDWVDIVEKHGITFEQAAAARQAASSDHNSRETPLVRQKYRIQSVCHPPRLTRKV
jgi:hypothetical protein